MRTKTRINAVLSIGLLLLFTSSLNAKTAEKKIEKGQAQSSAQKAAQAPGGQKPGHQTAVSSVSPCLQPESVDCLKVRLDESANRVDELQRSLDAITARLAALERLTSGMSSIGNPQQGKADGFDDLWSAIRELNNRLKRVEKQ